MQPKYICAYYQTPLPLVWMRETPFLQRAALPLTGTQHIDPKELY